MCSSGASFMAVLGDRYSTPQKKCYQFCFGLFHFVLNGTERSSTIGHV